MIQLDNNLLKLEINEFGGSMNSIEKNTIQYQWQGSEESWTGKDVVIFPFVARLKDGYYLVDGKKFELKNHGLLRYDKLNIEEKTKTKVTLSYIWSDKTLERYPYKFKFFISYELIENEIKISYKVVNLDDKTIYFGLGGHPAFNVPALRYNGDDDISGNYIEFDKEYDFYNYYLDENGSFIIKLDKYVKTNKIDLNKNIFKKYKTLILKADNLDNLTLVRKDGIRIKMKLNNPDTLAIWTKENLGAYICIEPWKGIPDFANPKRELKDKELIQSLDSNQVFNYSYSIIL